MKKVLLFVGVAALLGACSKNTDFSAPEEKNPTTETEVPNSMGITIDPAHTWDMTAQNTVEVVAYPEGFASGQLFVMDDNPLVNESAAILAYADQLEKTLTYEAPSSVTTLYAACISGKKMRVRAFKVAEGKVDFTKDLLNFTTSKASAPRRAGGLTFQPTLNATQFADKGWADQFAMLEAGNTQVEFTNFSEYAKTFSGFLPENQRNNRKLAAYDDILSCYSTTVSKNNGQVTIVPIHKESVISQCIGYYYFVPGEEHNIKTVKKYVFPSISKIDDNVNECTMPAYRLQYFDNEGNASYEFPEGTQIFFFSHVDQTTYNGALRNLIGSRTHMDWYANGTDNIDLSNLLYSLGYGTSNAEDGWQEFSHVVMFERGGEYFVGMEDWVIDFDYNDIIFMIRGDVKPIPSSDIETPSHTHIYTYAFEDTKEGDYDLNDVVLQVKRIYGGNNQEIKLVACGAHDRLFAFYKNESGQVKKLFGGKELHEALGVDQKDFVNTEKFNIADNKLPKDYFSFDYKTFRYAKADFYIFNETKNLEVHVPTAIGTVGSNPYGVCVPFAWAWPKEKTPVTKAYLRFAAFAENQQVNTDWYTTFVNDKVMK